MRRGQEIRPDVEPGPEQLAVSQTRGPRRPGWPTLLAANLLLLALLLSLVLGGAELYLRFFHDTTEGLNQTQVSRRWFERHWALNNMGVRDDVDYALGRAGGRRRVTFLGDSFTAAQGVPDVEDRFVNIVRRERPDWEVQGLAQLGADTPQELETVRMLSAHAYEFDVVALVYCWNDILPFVGDLQPFFQAMQTSRSEAAAFWIDHSLALDMLYYRYRLYRVSRALGDPIDAFDRAYRGAAWDRERRLLVELEQAVEEAGGHLVVITFPRLDPLTRGEVSFEVMHERLAALWSELGVPNLDLLPVLRSHGSSRLVVNSRDEHPGELTHRLAAEAIVAFLAPLIR